MGTAMLARMTESEARSLLEGIRWPNGPVCVHCGSINVCRLGGKAGDKGQIKCRDCRRKFTIRLGTIFEDSPLPLRDWVYAFARMNASKKGISAHQLHRELGVKYQTAWFMCHRIRHAMADGSFKLSGTIESDELYIGGKPRKRNYHASPKPGRPRKVGIATKVPVHTLVERDGRKHSRVMARVTANNLRRNIDKLVEDKSGTLMTDENLLYVHVGRQFKGGHETVNHGKLEYARGDAHINTAESAHALIKRGIYGIFHHVSKKHLQRYLDEFDFRWNRREMDDIGRTLDALKMAEGKRLMYHPIHA